MFSFYGSKNRIAHLYPAPIVDLIIEPFCGSASYSCRYWDRDVELYDVDHRIIAVWEYLIGATKNDILGLPVFGPKVNIDQFNYLSREEKWFLGYMISASTRNPKKTSTDRSHWTITKQRTIADNIYKCNHWKVKQLDFRQIENKEADWFIDPPYKKQGKWYDFRLKDKDYEDLANFAKSRLGQTIVCENYGEDWLPFQPLVELKGQTNNKKIEGIWTNENSSNL